MEGLVPTNRKDCDPSISSSCALSQKHSSYVKVQKNQDLKYKYLSRSKNNISVFNLIILIGNSNLTTFFAPSNEMLDKNFSVCVNYFVVCSCSHLKKFHPN